MSEWIYLARCDNSGSISPGGFADAKGLGGDVCLFSPEHPHLSDEISLFDLGLRIFVTAIYLYLMMTQMGQRSLTYKQTKQIVPRIHNVLGCPYADNVRNIFLVCTLELLSYRKR